MKFVTRMASRGHPGNKFHEITWVFRKQQEQEQEHREQQIQQQQQQQQVTSTTHSRGPSDFMKFVTRVAFRSHPGNKFYEITLVFRKRREQEQEGREQQQQQHQHQQPTRKAQVIS